MDGWGGRQPPRARRFTTYRGMRTTASDTLASERWGDARERKIHYWTLCQ